MSPLFRRRRPSAEDLRLVDELDALGFFRYAEDAAAAKAAVAKNGIDAIWRIETGRQVIAADAEDLAEGGVAEWLEELRPALERMGVQIDEDVEQEIDESRYVVRAGGREHTIYDLTGADAAAAEDPALVWGLSWSRAFALLNDLLERAGSSERAYAASDASVWFLTPEVFEALKARLGDDRDRPYVPTEEPRWFGAPTGGASGT